MIFWNHRIFARHGFSLIELSIVLIIGGIIMSALTAGLTLYLKSKSHRDTHIRIEKIETALKSYLEINGSYPCPASRTVKHGDTGFGRAPDKCAGDSDAAAKQKGIPSVLGRKNLKVRLGLLPFRSLGLSEEDSQDGWGNLFQYVVTENLTDAGTFDQKLGAIDILAEDGLSHLTPPATAQYAVISSGEDGKGSYASNGKRTSACPDGLLETNNCDDDAVFVDSPPRHVAKPGHGQSSQVDFDDIIAYQQYDPALNARGGLLFFYYGSCMDGFSEVDIGGHDVQDVPTLSKSPSFNTPGDPGEEKLCYSPRYAVSVTLLSKTNDGDQKGCPIGWTGIGYKLSQHANGYMSYAAGRQSTQYINSMVCAR